MGLLTADITKNTRINTETYVTGTTSLTYDAAILAQVSISAGATVQVIPNMDFLVAKLQFLYMICTEDVTLTFTTGTTTVVIALEADVPWQWDNSYSASLPCPFTYDATTCLAANAGADAGILTVRGGVIA